MIIMFSVSGCFKPRTPPDIVDIEKLMESKYEDITTVVNYMSNLYYDDIIISQANGEMLADLVNNTINDENVNKAISRLKRNNKDISFVKRGNNIFITIWTHPQEISSGIAYSINRIDIPEAQYQTEITPLSKDGWYYYICDYHIWRQEKGATKDGGQFA